MADPPGSSRPSRELRAVFLLAAMLLSLAAVAAAGVTYYDESATDCGSLISPLAGGPECPPYRAGREHLVVGIAAVVVLLLGVAALAPRLRVRAPWRPPFVTALCGLIAPLVEYGLLVQVNSWWGPRTEEYTGIPDGWEAVALAIGVFAGCLLASAGFGLELRRSLAAGAVALPGMALVQRLTTGWFTASPGSPLLWPDASGDQVLLALALSGLVLVVTLGFARSHRDGRSPTLAVASGAFTVTSTLVVGMQVVDLGNGMYPLARLNRAVWLIAWSVAMVAAAVVLTRTRREQHLP